MSCKTLPLLFINLGGEMIYILDQRLRAQNIADEKAKKVLHDIIATMFHKRFMDELFKPQPLYSKKAMRTVFDRLAHASIMRLNAASMDKLYDLMTMAFKYQVSMCLKPRDIILVTLNHLDAMRAFIGEASDIRQQLDHVYRLLMESFASLHFGEYQLIRQTLLNFFQDMHIRLNADGTAKVSIFLKDKVQNSNGRFVLPTSGPLPHGTEIPGLIRYYNEAGNEIKTLQFTPGGTYQGPQAEGSFDMKGNRVTKLGTNMYQLDGYFDYKLYSISRSVETSGSARTTTSSDLESSTPDPLAKAQLDLLSQLIGSKKASGKSEIRLNLFKTDQEEEQAEASVMKPIELSESQVVKIDASKKQKNEELNRIMGELAVNEGPSGDTDDLLDLMDQA